MAVELAKESIDLGIVTRDAAPMLAFYRDLLGFADEGEMPLPGTGRMFRLRCGSSVIKLVQHDSPPRDSAAAGGLATATGYRYWTISVTNLTALVDAARAAGVTIPVAPREIRPGVTIAMLEDPDGNWVELLQAAA